MDTAWRRSPSDGSPSASYRPWPRGGLPPAAPAFVLSPLRASAAGLRHLMPLGFRLQGISLLNALARESVRWLISALFGVAALATYQLADRLLLAAGSALAVAVLTWLLLPREDRYALRRSARR